MKQLSEATVMQEPSTKPAALKAAKCERIYREQASGGRWDRPELQRLFGSALALTATISRLLSRARAVANFKYAK
jgi:hypothetical protein